MQETTKHKSMSVQVFQLLNDVPHLRDDIWNLCTTVAIIKWINKATEYAKLVLTVDRISRKIQRQYPELRWSKWIERQKTSLEVKRQMTFEKIAQETWFTVTKITPKKTLLNTLTFWLLW